MKAPDEDGPNIAYWLIFLGVLALGMILLCALNGCGRSLHDLNTF